MNIDYTAYFMPSIVLASLCIGYIMKHWLPTDNRIIPTVLGVFGAISGFIVLGFNFNAFATGMFSGLAAVGGNQIYKQLKKSPTDDDELYTRGPGADFDPLYEEIDMDEDLGDAFEEDDVEVGEDE